MPTEDQLRARADRSELVFSLALFVVALAPRLFVALAWAKEPVWDGHYYHFGATRILEGFGYSEDVVDGVVRQKPWCHYPVGYSAFLAGAYLLFGAGLAVAPVLNALTGAALAVVGHQVALRFTSPTRARIAGGLIALHPGLIAYAAVVMTEPLAALGIMTAALWAVSGRNRAFSILGSGVLVGLTTLVRPPSLIVAALLSLLWMRRQGSAVLAGALALTVSVLTVVPWTLRNCAVMDGCAFVSTNGGWNLAIGAFTEDGRFRTLRARDGCEVVTGQVQQDRCWARIGIATIAEEPARWLALAPKKLSQTFDHESFAIEYLREADPAAWPEARRVAGRELLSAAHWLLLILAPLSAVAWPTRASSRSARAAQIAALALVLGIAAHAALADEHPFYWLLAPLFALALLPLPGKARLGRVGHFLVAVIGSTALTHVLFFGDDRYHIVVTPALCILAASALRSGSIEPPSPDL
jgi:4-amino-4-deoxy-L-arabinose transferase-like glycosyltransferase